MIMIPALFLGVILGCWCAYKNQGNKLDMLQYAAVHGIVFFIIGMFVSVTFDWLGWV